MDVDIRLTKDGSHSAYSHRFGQYYHNPNGALSESIHVFFETSGLRKQIEAKKRASILELGFGTGLNLIILADLAQKSGNKNISFTSVEAWPLTSEQAALLNFVDLFDNFGDTNSLVNIFKELKNNNLHTTDFKSIKTSIHRCLFDDFEFKEKFDFIFHDAFSPQVNPDLWAIEVFQRILDSTNEGAVLVTYCAATSARAAMAKAGWFIAKAPGALGKREMTIASNSTEKLVDFKRLNESLLKKRWDNGDFVAGK